MFYVAETKLEWLALVIENSYHYGSDMDKQIARLWSQYFNEMDPALGLEETYFLDK
jgi:hypothetical protein